MKLNTEKMIGEKEGGIGWMTFNNPARRNAMSLEMWTAVETILDEFESCLLYTSPSPRDKRQSRMPSSA